MSDTLIACIGKLNALHLGHLALVRAAADQGCPVLVSFADIDQVMGWTPRQPLLDPVERQRILADWSTRIGAPLREERLPFAAIQPLDAGVFLDHLRQHLGISGLVCGPDFRCGRDRHADVTRLGEMAGDRGLSLAVVAPTVYQDQPISSTRVRQAISAGDVATATAMLGRPYRLHGIIAHGDGRGRQLGYPTANLSDVGTLLPAPGVYAARAMSADLNVAAAVNIGHSPTVGRERGLTIEAHLLDCQLDCYGAPLALELIERIRDEQRFPSLNALTHQIAADVEAVRQVLGR